MVEAVSEARYIVADVFDGLRSLPDNSVDLVMSSPPFLALRSYLPADHELKSKEIGSEATPGAFLDVLLDVVEECARVLAPHGSLVFELGDTYAGGGASGWHRSGEEAEERYRSLGTAHDCISSGAGWPLDKSKVLVPQLFAISLAYGFNPLTGRTTEPWRVRNTVAWCRPNPPVGRDGDKFRPATSFLTVACKARDRYWDGDAVRVPYSDLTMKVKGEEWANGERGFKTGPKAASGETGRPMPESRATHAGAPLLDFWEIPTQPFRGSHYATYPANLVVPIVKAMCPERVCVLCGKPSTRITGEVEYVENPNPNTNRRNAKGVERRDNDSKTSPDGNRDTLAVIDGVRYAPTLGWTDCHHDYWRSGLVLDPFAGSGTTLQVATGHGRDAIGIDIDSRNAELAVERIGGLFLSVETLTENVA